MEDKRFTTLKTRIVLQTDSEGNFKRLFKTMAEAIYDTGIPFHSLQRLIKLKKTLNGFRYRYASEKDIREYERAIKQIDNINKAKEQKAKDEFDEIFDGFTVPVETIKAPVKLQEEEQLYIQLSPNHTELSVFDQMLKKAKENFGESDNLL